MDDLISRQAAQVWRLGRWRRMTYLELIESANLKFETNKLTLGEYERMIAPLKLEIQPEIIRCKDCKHADFGGQSDGRLYCMWNECHMYEDDYCSYAERDVK